jgi:hypothetical protein
MAPNGQASCPCCLRHAEKARAAARRRIAAALAVALITVLDIASLSGAPARTQPAATAAAASGPWTGPAARIALIAVALLALAAFAVLPVLTRASRRRAGARDWRARPASRGAPAAR